MVDLRKLVKNKLRRKLYCNSFNLLGIHGKIDSILIWGQLIRQLNIDFDIGLLRLVLEITPAYSTKKNSVRKPGLNEIGSITSWCSREPVFHLRTSRVCGGSRAYKRERALTRDFRLETLVWTRGSRIRTQDFISREVFSIVWPTLSSTLVNSQVFSVDTTPEKIKNAEINELFGFVFNENWAENHIIVFKTFSVHTKTKSARLQIPPVWRALSKSFVFVTD